MITNRLIIWLYMVAISTISCDKQLSVYYQRKVNEGKNKMLVINAIRNKVLHRLCSVIKRGTPYQVEYQIAYKYFKERLVKPEKS